MVRLVPLSALILLQKFRNILSQYKSPRLEELPTFTGGFVWLLRM